MSQSSETYISIDIEADGPIPGPHSMLSLGAAAYVERDGKAVLIGTFSANFETLDGAIPHPLTMSEFWDKQPEAWAACHKNVQTPTKALGEFVAWVHNMSGNPVCVGYPATFDFMFLYWYLIKFGYESPFSFSALDIKTYAMAVLKKPYRESTKRGMPSRWFPKAKHTHVAVDDAIEQGALFMNILLEHTLPSR
jgi:hypothetical protein